MNRLDSKQCADCPLAAILKQSIELNKMILKTNLERSILKPPVRNKIRARGPYAQYLN